MHIYDDRYPVDPRWTVPPPQGAGRAYKQVQRELGLERVVVVQPNAYGLDNRCTVDAIADLGPQARGIAIIAIQHRRRRFAAASRGRHPGRALLRAPQSIRDVGRRAEDRRARRGARLARAGADRTGASCRKYEALLRDLPTEVVIDHNGKFLEPVPPEHPGFRTLLRLLDTGRVWVKLSAPYETSKTGAPRYEDVSVLARALAKHNPERCVWASNWPHPGQKVAPSNANMLDLLLDWAPDEAVRKRILVDNPARLYGF